MNTKNIIKKNKIQCTTIPTTGINAINDPTIPKIGIITIGLIEF